jgi:hypothetical protein
MLSVLLGATQNEHLGKSSKTSLFDPCKANTTSRWIRGQTRKGGREVVSSPLGRVEVLSFSEFLSLVSRKSRQLHPYLAGICCLGEQLLVPELPSS